MGQAGGSSGGWGRGVRGGWTVLLGWRVEGARVWCAACECCGGVRVGLMSWVAGWGNMHLRRGRTPEFGGPRKRMRRGFLISIAFSLGF